jgi:hypothetical protein
MLLYLWLEQLLTVSPQALERICLIVLHEPAVTDYIGGQYGSKATFHSTLSSP